MKTMNKKKPLRLYNVLFPVWMLMWFPVLWLVLIPANFLIDFLVTRFTMKHLLLEDYHERAWKHSWKICLIGFLSDFVGALFLFAVYCYADRIFSKELAHTVTYGLNLQPFNHILTFAVAALSIILSGLCIYFLNRKMLSKDPSLDKKSVHVIARNLALITAPYLFLFPSGILYR